MHRSEAILLRRETRVIMIPEGVEMTLPEGTPVRITQALGGTFTIASNRGNLFRVDRADADALGDEAVVAAEQAMAEAKGAGGDLEMQIWAQMRTVFDPEIPVNVVDLGLVYSCEITGDPAADAATVEVKMTLTAPGCGMGDVIAADVRDKIEALDGVASAQVEIVLDPPWSQNMISDAAKLELGLL